MIAIVGTFIGGLGLFLLAVSMITDGLRLAAGDAVRDILARSTNTRIRGVLSGMLVTGVVQSSSAVTVATIGFVNAGLLTLHQSLGIIYGANIGTTVTSWIVAAVGFSFKVEVFALPMIGIGMLARLLKTGSRTASLGEALAGFGLFFIGVDVLQEAFQGFADTVDVGSFSQQGVLSMILYVAIGFFMTVVTQSSSAAIAITLTGATGGVLGLEAAAAMVIGANVGTTSTAALAVIGATPNARRVAAAHVLFNLLTGAVALLLLPLMLWLVRETGEVLGMADVPAVSLALFHTVFNVLGVLLMWPISSRLAEYLSLKFTTELESLGKPMYIDHNALANPAVAIDALRLEMARVCGLCRELVSATVSGEGPLDRTSADRMDVIHRLIDQIETFVSSLELERLPEAARGSLPLVLRTTGYLEEIIVLAKDLETHRADIDAIMAGEEVAKLVAKFQADVVEQLEHCDPNRPLFDGAELEAEYENLRAGWHPLKDALLQAAANRLLPISRLNSATEGLRTTLKISEQLTKAAIRLHVLETITEETDEAA